MEGFRRQNSCLDSLLFFSCNLSHISWLWVWSEIFLFTNQPPAIHRFSLPHLFSFSWDRNAHWDFHQACARSYNEWCRDGSSDSSHIWRDDALFIASMAASAIFQGLPNLFLQLFYYLPCGRKGLCGLQSIESESDSSDYNNLITAFHWRSNCLFTILLEKRVNAGAASSQMKSLTHRIEDLAALR